MKQGDSNNPIEPIEFRPALFWDVDPKTIDPEKNARYIIERVLDFGNDEEIRWVWKFYSHDLISDVVGKSRGLFPRTKVFWNLLLTNK